MVVGEQEFTRVSFEPTAKLLDLVRDGALLIFDEVQHLKNISAQFEAAKTMIAACNSSVSSKVLMLSGSPFDKQEHAVTLFRTLGTMQCNELSHFDLPSRTHHLTGLQQILDACSSWDAERTDTLKKQWLGNPRGLAYALFIEVVKPSVSAQMPFPCTTAKLHKFNAFYPLEDAECLEDLRWGLRKLEQACGFDRSTGTVNFAICGGPNTMKKLNRAMMAIEEAKQSTFGEAASSALLADPSAKVVICVNYTSTVCQLQQQLEAFSPLTLTGSVPLKKRASIISAFQQADSEHRLLLANCQVCSTGIDLDDKSGLHPRLCLVSPNYNTLVMHQLGHRFLRMDTKGDSEFHMLYITGAHELPVLNALARKGQVMKEIVPGQVEDGVVFPGDFPTKSYP